MLIQFVVKNFLSFDDEQVFSMVAGTDDQHPGHVVPGETVKGGAILRAAGVFGANAAGKSNLIEAIKFARELILTGTRSGQLIPLRAHKLRKPGVNHGSKFEFHIRTGGVLYNYGFELTSSVIVTEWLYATREKKEVTLFVRATSESGTVTVEVGPDLKQRSQKQARFLEFVALGTRPNQLFLTEADDRNVERIKPVVDWFRTALTIVPVEPGGFALRMGSFFAGDWATRTTQYLLAADSGVKQAAAVSVPLETALSASDLAEGQRQELLNAVQTLGFGKSVRIQSPNGRVHYFERSESGEPVCLEMTFYHQAPDDDAVAFSIDEESDGTRRLIDLIPVLEGARGSQDRVILIDEIDRHFHHHLTRMLIETALTANIPGRSTQLIFTTHDTNLLDLDLLRRDEIWFMEKDEGGASHLHSLAEFKVRPDLKIAKGYLNGRFGAIPRTAPLPEWTAQGQAVDEPDRELSEAA